MSVSWASRESAPQVPNLEHGSLKVVLLSVPSMKCAACIGKIEERLSQIKGVNDPRVNLTLKRVSLSSDLPVEHLIKALQSLGYEAHPFEPSDPKINDDAISKKLILRLAVAGFAMMNVMLLSVAIWSGASDSTRDMFHLISAFIALPATIFAGQPFFHSAWTNLSKGRLNMDVPISLAILLASGMSFFESLNSGIHAYFDAGLALTFFLLIGRVLEHQTRSVARSAVADLAALEVQTARRQSGTNFVDVKAAALCVGDIVQVPNGMRVPVDGKILDRATLTDRAFITGESDPVVSQPADILHAGEVNLGAPFLLEATAVGEETNLRQIAALVETAEHTRNRYTTIADKAAKLYAPIVHLLALVTFIGWISATGDLRQALNIAIAVLIITCPCALGLAVPAVATAAVSKLFSKGVLIKSGTALERLSEVDTVVFDKTGTLTLPVRNFDLGALNKEEISVVKALAQVSSHPVSKALAEQLKDVLPSTVSSIIEIPGKGLAGMWFEQDVALGRGQWLGAPRDNLTLKIKDICKPIKSKEDLREGAVHTIAFLKRSGLDIAILSGDAQEKTATLAKTLEISNFYAEVTPFQKLQIIRSYQSKRRKVVMLGDGINDTAALAAADVSLAPGTALDAARNAADVVLLRRSFDDLPMLFRIAKATVKLSKQNFVIASFYNVLAVPLAVAGFATPLLAALAMSASSITVLLNALRINLVR